MSQAPEEKGKASGIRNGVRGHIDAFSENSYVRLGLVIMLVGAAFASGGTYFEVRNTIGRVDALEKDMLVEKVRVLTLEVRHNLEDAQKKNGK